MAKLKRKDSFPFLFREFRTRKFELRALKVRTSRLRTHNLEATLGELLAAKREVRLRKEARMSRRTDNNKRRDDNKANLESYNRRCENSQTRNLRSNISLLLFESRNSNSSLDSRSEKLKTKQSCVQFAFKLRVLRVSSFVLWAKRALCVRASLGKLRLARLARRVGSRP